MSSSQIYLFNGVHKKWTQDSSSPRELIETAAGNIGLAILYDKIFSKRTIAKFYFGGANIESEFSGSSLKISASINNPESSDVLNRLLVEIKFLTDAREFGKVSDLIFVAGDVSSRPKKKKKKRSTRPKTDVENDRIFALESRYPVSHIEVIYIEPVEENPALQEKPTQAMKQPWWYRFTWLKKIFPTRRVG